MASKTLTRRNRSGKKVTIYLADFGEPMAPHGILHVHSFSKNLPGTVLDPEDAEEKVTALLRGAEILDPLCPRLFSHQPHLAVSI